MDDCDQLLCVCGWTGGRDDLRADQAEREIKRCPMCERPILVDRLAQEDGPQAYIYVGGEFVESVPADKAMIRAFALSGPSGPGVVAQRIDGSVIIATQ